MRKLSGIIVLGLVLAGCGGEQNIPDNTFNVIKAKVDVPKVDYFLDGQLACSSNDANEDCLIPVSEAGSYEIHVKKNNGDPTAEWWFVDNPKHVDVIVKTLEYSVEWKEFGVPLDDVYISQDGFSSMVSFQTREDAGKLVATSEQIECPLFIRGLTFQGECFTQSGNRLRVEGVISEDGCTIVFIHCVDGQEPHWVYYASVKC